jgi:hypothetical protein
MTLYTSISSEITSQFHKEIIQDLQHMEDGKAAIAKLRQIKNRHDDEKKTYTTKLNEINVIVNKLNENVEAKQNKLDLISNTVRFKKNLLGLESICIIFLPNN